MRRFASICLLLLLGLMGYNCLLCSQMLSLLRAGPAPTTVRAAQSGGKSASPAPVRQDTPDIRERLLSSFKHTDKDFVQYADGYQLTHFSYLGALTTQQGKVYVCEVRWVLPGMQAPRGFSCIVFSDRHLRYLGKSATRRAVRSGASRASSISSGRSKSRKIRAGPIVRTYRSRTAMAM